MLSKFDHSADSFVCLNSPDRYKAGSICLPTSILAKYGCNVPSRVYVELPSGALWRGSYCRTQNCIEGLQSLFSYYDVKQYHVFVLFYGGGHKFSLEIFNVYGVEIFYKLHTEITTDKPVTAVEAVWLNDCYYLSSDFELDKLHGQFSFNCVNASSVRYELVIGKQHLQPKIYNQILSKEACSKLRLEDYTTIVEIGFKKLMWKIELQWINGEVFFNKNWCDLAKEGKLCEGDICVFQKTAELNKFQVAVFEKKNVGEFNKLGVTQGKSVMKFVKVLDANSVMLCELDVPRVFVNEYGLLLLENVHLLMPDGDEFIVGYSESLQKLNGLQKLLMTYRMGPNYVLLFDYVGRSHFLLTVYNEKGEDVFCHLRRKVLLHDIMLETECPLTSESDWNHEPTVEAGCNVASFGSGNMGKDDGKQSFTMELTSANIYKTGHGLYIGSTLLHIFRKWTTGTKVTLLHGELPCLVEVDRRVDVLYFEKGWKEFTSTNELKVGQKLKFVYRGNYTFKVYIDV